jgi:thioredoxin 1
MGGMLCFSLILKLDEESDIPTARGSEQILTLTSSTFKPLVLDAQGRIAVEFMSYGCSHCRAIEPVLQKVADIVQPNERIFRVNIGVEQDLANNYAIAGTPTLIMFLNGSEVGRAEGPQPTIKSVMAAVTQPFES